MRHFNPPGTIATGDLNDDGKVDFQDLVLLARNYGHPLPTSAVAALLDATDAAVVWPLPRRHRLEPPTPRPR